MDLIHELEVKLLDGCLFVLFTGVVSLYHDSSLVNVPFDV
jgi:hypothetical protein